MMKQEYIDRLVDAAYVDLFLAGVDGARLDWPWRMAKKGDSLAQSYRDSCDIYWVDSAIMDSSYGNRDVLDHAHQYDADAALLADTMGKYAETVDSLKEGLDLADNHAFEGEIILPLQAPYDKCYNEFAGESDVYAIGGLKDARSDKPRIDAARTVRELAGYDIHLHGLGWGPRDGLLQAIHDNPSLLDSIDYATPLMGTERAMPGEERLSVVAMCAAETLTRDLRKLTPFVDRNPNPDDLRDSNQVGLSQL